MLTSMPPQIPLPQEDLRVWLALIYHDTSTRALIYSADDFPFPPSQGQAPGRGIEGAKMHMVSTTTVNSACSGGKAGKKASLRLKIQLMIPHLTDQNDLQDIPSTSFFWFRQKELNPSHGSSPDHSQHVSRTPTIFVVVSFPNFMLDRHTLQYPFIRKWNGACNDENMGPTRFGGELDSRWLDMGS